VTPFAESRNDTFLVDEVDCSPVPYVAEVSLLLAVAEEARFENGEAFAFRPPDACVRDPIGPVLAKLVGNGLGGRVIGRMVKSPVP
jgi:hypothetical protein